MRRWAVAIWAARVAPNVRSYYRVRVVAHSRSFKASRAAWMAAMVDASAESVEGVAEVQVASEASERVVENPAGCLGRRVSDRRPVRAPIVVG